MGELAAQLTTATPLTDVMVWRVPSGPPVPTTASLVIRPGRLGPLAIGMSGTQAIAAGWVRRKVDVCDTRYRAVDVRGYSEPAFHTDFRDGSPDDLDGILINVPGPHTPEGIEVGSTVTQVRQIYGNKLQRLAYDPQAGERLAVQGEAGWMVMGVQGLHSGAVTYFDLAGPTRTNEVPEGGHWEC